MSAHEATPVRQVRPGDRILLPDGEERTVLNMDPHLDGYVELVFTDGTIRIYRSTATVLALTP
jgi:hypothetical protein